ncbi:SLOG family protein [Feifania hominis]|uniref:SLOG family protein n=1 Tax=Feifania hominis TaxID=2763660 RepID=UPI00201618F8
MKVAIIGSRKAPESVYELLAQYVPLNASEIVSGGAVGIDRLAERYARENGLALKTFLPNYHKYAKSAPLERNRQIVAYSDLVLAVWDGKSPGTKFVINYCLEQGRAVKVILY